MKNIYRNKYLTFDCDYLSDISNVIFTKYLKFNFECLDIQHVVDIKKIYFTALNIEYLSRYLI